MQILGNGNLNTRIEMYENESVRQILKHQNLIITKSRIPNSRDIILRCYTSENPLGRLIH